MCFCVSDEQNIYSDFWQLWQEHQHYLHRCCVKWIGNDIDAEDVLSRAMLKAWDKLLNYNAEIKNFKLWVTKLTYNLCIDIHRERRRGAKQVESLDAIDFAYQEEIASQEENPVLAATQQELEKFFVLTINELPSRLRETFILHLEEELSYKEIAEKLNISYANVRKQISQARKILQQRYYQDFLEDNNNKYEEYRFVSQPKPRNNYRLVKQTGISNSEAELSSQEKMPEAISILKFTVLEFSA